MKTKTKIIIDNPTHPTTNPTKVEQIPISNNKTLEYHKANGNIIFVVFSNETVNPDSEKEFSLSIETSILQEQINYYFKDEPIEFEFNTSFSPIGKHVKDYDIKGVIVNQYKKLEDCEDYGCGDYYFYINSTLILKEDIQMFESMVSSFEDDSGFDTNTVIKGILIPHIPESLKTAVVECKEIIEVNTPKVIEEPIIGQKKREYVKKELSFQDLVRLSPKIICKPSKGVMFPSKLLYEGKKIRPITFIRLVCALNDIPVFTKTEDKFKVVKGENLLSAMVKGLDLNDTFVYMDGSHVSILTFMGYTVEDIHWFLKQNYPKSLEKIGISKTFSRINVLVKMKNLPLFTDGEKKQFIVFPFDYLRDVSSSIELLSNTIEISYDVYGATMNPTTKVFIISRYFIDCDLTSKEISNIKQSL